MTMLKGKDLDDFFRKQLSNGDIPFDEANWLRLEKQLKRTSRKNTVTWITLSGIAAALLISLSVTYVFYRGNQNQPQFSAIKKQSQAPAPSLGRQPLKEFGSDKNPEYLKPEEVNRITGTRVRKGYYANKKINAAPVTAPNEEATGKTPHAEVSDLPVYQNIASNTDSTYTAGSTGVSDASEPVTEAPVLANNSTAASDLPNKESRSEAVQEPVSGSNRISLSLLAGPDINGVNNLKSNRGGISVGLMANYRLTKSLSISTGAVYAKKLYNSEFEYYSPNSSYKFPVPPKIVNADCRVLDIPLNINYAIWSKAKDAIVLSGGVSSYLMLNEQYSFTYENPAARGPKTYFITNKNKHYLGILNFAAGYQRVVTNQISIGIQPYFKLPVTDIGYGNVKLLSTGIVTSVQLNLPAKAR